MIAERESKERRILEVRSLVKFQWFCYQHIGQRSIIHKQSEQKTCAGPFHLSQIQYNTKTFTTQI